MSFEQVDPLSQVEAEIAGEDGQEVEVVGMDEETIQATAGRMIRDAIVYSDSELGPIREEATNYYKGRPFGDEEEGRSQIVITTVRDTILAMMPSVMRTFFGPTLIGEFTPTSQETIDQAKLATRVVDHVIKVENPGWRIIHAASKDAMLKKKGIVKYWWDDSPVVENDTLQDLTEDQVLMLEADPEIEYEVTGQTNFSEPSTTMAAEQALQQYNEALGSVEEDQIPALMQELGPAPQIPEPIILYDCDVKRTRRGGRVRIQEVPPEEFLYTADGTSIEDAAGVWHRQDRTRSQLLALGIDEDLLDGHFSKHAPGARAHSGTELKHNAEAISRTPGQHITSTDVFLPELQEIPYYEGYVYMDINGDGIAEHVKLILFGHNPTLAFEPELAPERPFAVFEIDPEPHTIEGNSIHDRVSDLQLVESKIMRGTLDSLAFALHPRTAVVEGQVNIGDVMNTEIGAIIRERQPGMVRELPTSFAGAQALPILEYFKTTKEERTGISRAAAGLDPDSLQSSTKAAVAATVSGAQQHLDLLVRMLAQTGLKQLMVGVLKLLIRHQHHSRNVRLNGQFVKFDPRHWDAMMDFDLNVGVGMTMPEQRLAMLRALKADQLEALQLYGATGNPLVTVGQYSQTLQRIAELTGAPEAGVFFKELRTDFDIPQPPPKPAPEEILANAEAERVKGDLEREGQVAQHKMQLETKKSAREDAKVEADIFLRAKDLEMKYHAKNVEAEAKRIMAKAAEKKASQTTTTGA